MDVDVTAVPRREEGMEPWEVMTSESQERMLAIVTPESWPQVAAICEKWEVRATVIGKVMAPDAEGVGRLRIREGFDGPVLADIPAASLSDDAPLYDRPMEPAPIPAAATPLAPPDDAAADLLALLRSPRWVYRQYDHQLFLNTVVGPGADAALLRLAGPGLPASNRGVALTTDSNPRACAIDPRHGTALVLAEGVANLACVGATPVAVVNCLNFGNPEHAKVMWQLSECIDGMTEACRALELPVIGGNVSFYNESGGADIHPTPVLGVLGLVDELRVAPPGLAWEEGDTVLMLGARGEAHALSGTRWAAERRDSVAGPLPALDLGVHRKVAALVAALVRDVVAGVSPRGVINAVHDVSAGGLAVAVAEMAAASGLGCTLELGDPSELFSEEPSRFVVASKDPDALSAAAASAGVPAVVLGRVGGGRVVLGDLVDLALESVVATHEGALASALGDG
jgi:phosphoribosylformylglycinamidine synthase